MTAAISRAGALCEPCLASLLGKEIVEKNSSSALSVAEGSAAESVSKPENCIWCGREGVMNIARD